MILLLDNAESILDSQGTDAQEIYAVVEELCQLNNICLCFTSRVSTVPPDCKYLDIPTLSTDAAYRTFCRIYDGDERSKVQVNGILEQLDFHPLSITLLATVAQQNKWDTDRLTREWEERRTSVLHVQHNKSLATTIELSLASPMFQELGPEARDLLGVVAFFPQGVSENNFDWLFPTISDRRNIFDKLCVLSLTYRSNGFVTMLAPLRDYLRPKDLGSSPLLNTTKDHYIRRLQVGVGPNIPGFEEARWIISEDINVEHLLDAFTSVDGNSIRPWSVCDHFMEHLYWHKKRIVILGPKIERLPDNHPFKRRCLFQLSRLFASVGNHAESKRLLIRTLKLWSELGDNLSVAQILRDLADADQRLGLYKDGISHAKEALGIYERLNHILGQVRSLQQLAWLLQGDDQLGAAEEAALRAIDLLQDEDSQFLVCKSHRLLGDINSSKGETEKATNHFEVAIGIASSFNWYGQLLRNHCSLVELFSKQGKFGDAQAHLEHAKPYAVNEEYFLGRTVRLQAGIWYGLRKFEEAKSEALRAAEVFEKLGATKELEVCRDLLCDIEREMNKPVTSSR